MLRRTRSTGKNQQNINHSNTNSNSSGNNSNSQEDMVPSHPRKSSVHSDSDQEDEDDDLRSLLSGNSLGERYSTRPQHTSLLLPSRQQTQLQQSQSQQGVQQPPLVAGGAGQNQKNSIDHHNITHLPLSVGDDNNNNMNNMMSTSGNNSALHHAPSNARSKKLLWTLGTIILAVGVLGPSGLLWDLFEEDLDNEQNVAHYGMDGNVGGSGVTGGLGSAAGGVASRGGGGIDRNLAMHGDKHHHLSPPHTDNHNANMEYVHPMIRSSTAMDKATGNANNNKFGNPNNNPNRNARNKKRDKGRIKEAIENIDKVFLDNRPVAVTTVQKKRVQRSRENGNGNGEDDDAFLTLTDDEATTEFLPVVHADDETLPANADALDAVTYALPASDALECRASVVAFVINATDVRDECDGLRKAFDKTCSVHSGPAGGAVPVAPVVNNEGGGSALPRERNRRRLMERGRPHLWNLIPVAFQKEIEKAGGRLRSHLKRRLGERNLHLTGSNRTMHAMSSSRSNGVERRTQQEQSSAEAQQQPAAVVQQKQEQAAVAPPLISLNIPTADKHISEEMLNDALLLQSSEAKPSLATSADVPQALQQQQQQAAPVAHEVLPHGQPPPPDLPPKPNMTADAAEAVQDAAESAEAIRTAVEGVKSIMNDPKSIEARTCCASILSVFHEHCDPTTTGVEDYSDRRLLVVVFVITVCGMVKSVIRHLNIRWLPEAGGCILVGVFGYLILQHMPHVQFAFDGDMFLRIMVPPIVFEAAVKINKQSFRRHVIPITIFAIVGTLVSTTCTAFILHKGSAMLKSVTTIPVKESLIFGALISSIDPIAVLSVLNNMGMTDSDTIYVLIFGESLLNDGVAIVLFQTLVHFLDESLVIDSDVVLDAFMHFVVVALGSVTVGMASGACATVYFALMHGCQTPMVEVIMFCCWSFIPYYICDMVEWSGIVAIVANGFVMDLYVIGQKPQHQHNGLSSIVDDEIDFLVNGSSSNGGNNTSRARNRPAQCRRIFSYEGHLSGKADSHVHFVIEIFATLMETAIFAYLGLFLFSPRYHWSRYLTFMSIFATVMGRVIMIPMLSHVGNIFNRMNMSRNRSNGGLANNMEGVHIDRRMQLVLVFAGLRGAMSFALVEHIPMFDTTTGQGSRFKPELKAMTSASVIFTVFVLGGATSYLMERLGYSLNTKQADAVEIVPLVQHHHEKRTSPAAKRHGLFSSANESANNSRLSGSVRQRGPR